MLSSLLGGVIGALVAGVFLLAAENWRAKRDRAFARHAISVSAARTALLALADYLKKGDFVAARSDDAGRRELAQRVDRLVAIVDAEALLLPEKAVDRCRTLVDLVTQLQNLSVVEGREPGELVDPQTIQPGTFTLEMTSRAMQEVAAYGEYVQSTLLAVIDDRPLPDDAGEPPVLHRMPDGSVWQGSGRRL